MAHATQNQRTIKTDAFRLYNAKLLELTHYNALV